MKRAILLAALAAAVPAFAEAPDATTKSEISHLINYLGSSGCQFNRNGTWYDASRAVAHLNRKYKYLLKKDLVGNAEAFIQRAASESSASGKPYLVRCGNGPEMQSAVWFRAALLEFRARSSDGQEHH